MLRRGGEVLGAGARRAGRAQLARHAPGHSCSWLLGRSWGAAAGLARS